MRAEKWYTIWYTTTAPNQSFSCRSTPQSSLCGCDFAGSGAKLIMPGSWVRVPPLLWNESRGPNGLRDSSFPAAPGVVHGVVQAAFDLFLILFALPVLRPRDPFPADALIAARQWPRLIQEASALTRARRIRSD